jgi:hypothetical protein
MERQRSEEGERGRREEEVREEEGRGKKGMVVSLQILKSGYAYG